MQWKIINTWPEQKVILLEIAFSLPAALAMFSSEHILKPLKE